MDEWLEEWLEWLLPFVEWLPPLPPPKAVPDRNRLGWLSVLKSDAQLLWHALEQLLEGRFGIVNGRTA